MDVCSTGGVIGRLVGFMAGTTGLVTGFLIGFCVFSIGVAGNVCFCGAACGELIKLTIMGSGIVSIGKGCECGNNAANSARCVRTAPSRLQAMCGH
ncbi:MAG: hypothetical protein Q8S52_14585 [Methylobacter sp.]|nr:hypothetical protein [Methylobacter sp.]MDP2427409.1 hypothetical protein [Methylobacter sp.]MDP3363334.1 hypothetical protein [Methylobacter sp.]